MDLASFETIEEVDTFASYVGPLIRGYKFAFKNKLNLLEQQLLLI